MPKYVYVDDVYSQEGAIKDAFPGVLVLADITHVMRRIGETLYPVHCKRGKWTTFAFDEAIGVTIACRTCWFDIGVDVHVEGATLRRAMCALMLYAFLFCASWLVHIHACYFLICIDGTSSPLWLIS